MFLLQLITLELVLTPEREHAYCLEIDGLQEQIRALTTERDTAVARILELEDNNTEMMDHYEAEVNRLQAQVDFLRQQSVQRRAYIALMARYIVGCLRALANFITQRLVVATTTETTRCVYAHVYRVSSFLQHVTAAFHRESSRVNVHFTANHRGELSEPCISGSDCRSVQFKH